MEELDSGSGTGSSFSDALSLLVVVGPGRPSRYLHPFIPSSVWSGWQDGAVRRRWRTGDVNRFPVSPVVVVYPLWSLCRTHVITVLDFFELKRRFQPLPPLSALPNQSVEAFQWGLCWLSSLGGLHGGCCWLLESLLWASCSGGTDSLRILLCCFRPIMVIDLLMPPLVAVFVFIWNV